MEQNDDQELAKKACAALFRDAVQKGRFQHVLIYHRLRLNQEMCEIAKSITGQLENEARPVVVLCAYARNQIYGYGLSIFLNRAAESSIKPNLIQAQRKLFITAAEYETLLATDTCDSLTSKKPRVGEYVYHSSFTGHRIFQRNVMGSGLEQGIDYDMDSAGVVHLPSKMNFRVRSALTLILEACKLAGIAQDSLLLATIGKTLLKEGLTVKTWSHELAPTVEICPIDHDKFSYILSVEVLQAFGRICGIRKDGSAPFLVVRSDILESFRNIVSFNEELIKVLAQATREHPRTGLRMTIGDALRQIQRQPTLQIPTQIAKRKVQVFPSECYFGGSPDKLMVDPDLVEFRTFLLSKLSHTELVALTKACLRLRSISERAGCTEREPSIWMSDVELAKLVDYDEFPALVKKCRRWGKDYGMPFIEKLDDMVCDISIDPTIEDIDERAFLLVAKDKGQPGSESYGRNGLIVRYNELRNATPSLSDAAAQKRSKLARWS